MTRSFGKSKHPKDRMRSCWATEDRQTPGLPARTATCCHLFYMWSQRRTTLKSWRDLQSLDCYNTHWWTKWCISTGYRSSQCNFSFLLRTSSSRVLICNKKTKTLTLFCICFVQSSLAQHPVTRFFESNCNKLAVASFFQSFATRTRVQCWDFFGVC